MRTWTIDSMNDKDHTFGKCRRCGTDASLSVCHPDGVFKDVCRDCFNKSLKPSENRIRSYLTNTGEE